VAADLAIVRDVGVAHDQVVVADSGAGSAFDGAAVDVTNSRSRCGCRFRGGWVRRVGDVLRGEADGAEGEELIVRSDSGCALDDYVEARWQASPSSTLGRLRSRGRWSMRGGSWLWDRLRRWDEGHW